MTNSRLTDPEVLEWRYPVRLESFEIRHGSGGAAAGAADTAQSGMRFLEPMTAAILSGHRLVRPHGLHGGEPALGAQLCPAGRRRHRARPVRPDGDGVDDVFVIETPGGGGYGTIK